MRPSRMSDNLAANQLGYALYSDMFSRVVDQTANFLRRSPRMG
jgi:hypothetical protein